MEDDAEIANCWMRFLSVLVLGITIILTTLVWQVYKTKQIAFQNGYEKRGMQTIASGWIKVETRKGGQ